MNRGQTTVCPMLLSDRTRSRKSSSQVSFRRIFDDVQFWKEVRSNEPEKKRVFLISSSTETIRPRRKDQFHRLTLGKRMLSRWPINS